ncbi:unnamed protein product [Protopolystoma xenopodis]|uniref:G-protein coupled receptors family 1 profile domain-containing protein n=1 Tax=Protopolystoma xenopodis TaxID=117903 RepID=A0A448XC23_9PLAT|nr:unnamed protein product [Protopolystoma xenopodis]
MVNGALLIHYNGTCSIARLYNISRLVNSSHVSRDDRLPASKVLALTFSLLALITNAFCMNVFLQQRRKSVMRTNLLLLSFTEVCFHLCLSMDYVVQFVVSSVEIEKPNAMKLGPAHRYIFYALIVFGSDFTLCTRNWCNVLITSARSEVVVFPLRARKCFARNRILTYYLYLIFISCLASLVRVFYERIIVCHLRPEQIIVLGGTTWTELGNLMREDIIGLYEKYGFFIYQTMVPLLVVTTLSGMIACYISPWRKPEIATANVARRRHQMKATKTILLLASLFCLFQTPNFIFVFLSYHTNLLESNWHNNVRTMWVTVADLLLTCDSICNIIVYAQGLTDFRHHLHCRLRKRHSDRWTRHEYGSRVSSYMAGNLSATPTAISLTLPVCDISKSNLDLPPLKHNRLFIITLKRLYCIGNQRKGHESGSSMKEEKEEEENGVSSNGSQQIRQLKRSETNK